MIKFGAAKFLRMEGKTCEKTKSAKTTTSKYLFTLRIIGPSYRGVWICIAGFWDLQTTSVEIPWFLGQGVNKLPMRKPLGWKNPGKIRQTFPQKKEIESQGRLNDNHPRKVQHTPRAHPFGNPPSHLWKERTPLWPVGKGFFGVCSSSVCWNNLRKPNHMQRWRWTDWRNSITFSMAVSGPLNRW